MTERIKSNRVRILHMLRAIDTIKEFGVIDMWNLKDYSATVWQLQIIGEAANHIEVSIRNKYTNIPWKNIIGFRHYAVHEYEGVLHEAIKAALKDLPKLKSQLQAIIDDHADDF